MGEHGVLFVCVADAHPNSCSGLFPPQGIVKHTGNTVLPNPLQEWSWARWEAFWNDAEDAALSCKADEIWVAVVGDGADDNKHDRYGLISLFEDDQVAIGVEVLRRPRQLAEQLFVFAGTEAHSGPYWKLECRIAHELGATPAPGGELVWRHGLIDCCGVLHDIQHHPKHNSREPWTVGGGAGRESAYLEQMYARRAHKPDLAWRAHVHHFEESGKTQPIRTLFLPCWQLQTNYGDRLGFVPGLEPIGGIWTLCKGGTYSEPEVRLYTVPEGEPWRP